MIVLPPVQEDVEQPVFMSRIVMTPDQRMDTENAARYVGRSVDTMKAWRYRKIGPPYVVMGKRSIWYFKKDLDAFISAQRREVAA
jgi:hypothetical protein